MIGSDGDAVPIIDCCGNSGYAGNSEHLTDDVDAGILLGHRVLDLGARVHFEEVDVTLAGDEKFASPAPR